MNDTTAIQEFDPDCRKCPRLAEFLDDVKRKHPGYHARPVAPFGDNDSPKLLVVGLAPGLHGANATGRPFTGDFAGILLYKTLYEFGFGSKPQSISLNDGLQLKNCRITNAVKCLPPQNKPTSNEINRCNAYLSEELRHLDSGSVVLALGAIAHNAILKACDLRLSDAKFGHNRMHPLPGQRFLVDSYHSSRYNIQTKRLTDAMFVDVFRSIEALLHGSFPT
ncbi:MAG: uracil-DNA glycosylase [Gammaproteobacteria bacterium]